MRRDDYLYVERQTLHPIAWAGAIVAGLAGLAALFPIPGAETPVGPERGITGLVALAVSAFLLNVLPMSTWVDAAEVRVQFGSLLPFYTKRIPVARVDSARPVEYRPLVQAGGWGIRWGRFDGKRTRYLNARGNRGVLFEGENLRFIVGSQHPEKFAEAVSVALTQAAADRKRHGGPSRQPRVR